MLVVDSLADRLRRTELALEDSQNDLSDARTQLSPQQVGLVSTFLGFVWSVLVKSFLDGYHCVNFIFQVEFSSRLAVTDKEAEMAAKKSEANIVNLKNQIARLKEGTRRQATGC